MFVLFEVLDVSCAFSGAPAEDESDVVDQTRLAQFAKAFFVVVDINHGKHNSEQVLSLERFDAGVDIFWM